MKKSFLFLALFLLLFTLSCNNGGSSGGGGRSSAPTLKSVTISPNSGYTGNTITIDYNLSFSDPDGDLDGGTANYNDGLNVTSFALSSSLSGLNDGSSSGQITITITPNPGTYNVSCWLVDKKGNRSNTLTTTFAVFCSGSTSIVRCGSEGFQYKQCLTGSSIRKSVVLQTQFSFAECIRDQSWGVGDYYIWVNQGCDANFLVCRY